jgi:thiamine biosynthesis lipoprotein
MTRPGLAAALVLGALAALPACDGEGPLRRQQSFVLGTVVTIEASGVTEQRFREGAGAAFRAMRELHRAFDPEGEANPLARFNQAPADSWRPVPPPMDRLLPRALAVRRASGNRFDPTMGRLIELWGLRSPPFPESPPPASAVHRLLERGASGQPLALRRTESGLEARLEGEEAALALGGIAKGYALDRAAAVLRDHGVTDALIDAGGDLRALGRRGDRRWRVGIRRPRGETALAVLALEPGEAIVTSGDYERFFVHEGARYHHLLDPATGFPARGIRSATVVGPRATEADAWSTALFVAGRSGLERMGAYGGLIVDSAGKPHANAPLASRLDWRGPPPPDRR